MDTTDTIASYILTKLVIALMALIGGYVAAYIHKHMSASQIETGMRIARIVVNAAEQIGKHTTLGGPMKLEIALNRARDLAGKAGIRFTDDQWRSFIEQAVHEINGFVAALEPFPATSVEAPSVFAQGSQAAASALTLPPLVFAPTPPGTPIAPLPPLNPSTNTFLPGATIGGALIGHDPGETASIPQ